MVSLASAGGDPSAVPLPGELEVPKPDLGNVTTILDNYGTSIYSAYNSSLIYPWLNNGSAAWNGLYGFNNYFFLDAYAWGYDGYYWFTRGPAYYSIGGVWGTYGYDGEWFGRYDYDWLYGGAPLDDHGLPIFGGIGLGWIGLEGWTYAAYGYGPGGWYGPGGLYTGYAWLGGWSYSVNGYSVDTSVDVKEDVAEYNNEVDSLSSQAADSQLTLGRDKDAAPPLIDAQTGEAELGSADGSSFTVTPTLPTGLFIDGVDSALQKEGGSAAPVNVQDRVVKGFEAAQFEPVANSGTGAMQTSDSVLANRIDSLPPVQNPRPANPTALQNQKGNSADKIPEQTVLAMADDGMVTFCDAPVGYVIDGKQKVGQDHKRFAVVADAVGNRIVVLVLERYDAPEGTFYRVVYQNGLGVEMEENPTIEEMAGHLAYYRSKKTAQSFVDIKVINPRMVDAMRQAASWSHIGKELLLNLIPGRATLQHIKNGEPGEAAISLLGDAALILSAPLRLFTAAGKAAAVARGAAGVAQGFAEAGKVIQMSAITIESTVAGVRLGQAYALLKNDDNDPNKAGKIAGYLGEAILRLFSVTVQLKKLPAAAKGEITWVEEPRTKNVLARDYEESAPGARSSVATQRKEVPSLSWIDETGAKRTTKFDGIDGDVLIDRKRSITGFEDTEGQVLRQSEALVQNGYTAFWEVPDETEARRAVKLFESLNIFNIEVRVVPQ